MQLTWEQQLHALQILSPGTHPVMHAPGRWRLDTDIMFVDGDHSAQGISLSFAETLELAVEKAWNRARAGLVAVDLVSHTPRFYIWEGFMWRPQPTPREWQKP